jgi:hypothetical protein
MSDIIARCGYKCNLCLIYRENLKKDEKNGQRFRDALEKYYGDKLTLEQCYCDGCMTPDIENPIRIDKNCKVRPCVIAREIVSCAYCDQYPCQEVEKKMIDGHKVEEKYGTTIPEDDYKQFIMPYESRQVLDKIRNKLG